MADKKSLATGSLRNDTLTRELLWEMLEKTTDFVGLISSAGKMLFVNTAGYAMLGWDEKSERKPTSLADFHSESSKKKVLAEIIPCTKSEGRWKGELDFLHRDGRTIPMSMVVVGHTDAEGKLEHLSMIARDISAEKAAQKESLQFRQLLDQSNDSILVARPEDGRLLHVNETACKRLGYSRSKLLTMKVSDISFSAADPAAWRDLSAKVRKMGVLLFETKHKCSDGSTFPVEVNVRFVPNRTGGHLIAVVRDLTQRRIAEEALTRKDQLLRRLTDNVPVLISYIDKDMRFVFSNAFHTKIFGRRTEDISGMPMSEVLGEEAFRAVRTYAENALSGTPVTFEAALPLKSGVTRHFSASYVPHFGDTGKVEGFFSAQTDITAAKALESDLLQSQKMEALGTLASGIAHEFNNILAAIMMQSYSIRPEVEDMPAVREAIDDIVNVTERARDLISQMKSSTKPRETIRKNTDVNAVLSRMLRMVRPLVGGRINVRLKTSAKSLTTGLNEAQFEHAVMNLVLNSRDAIPDTGNIEIRTSRVPPPQGLKDSQNESASGKYILVEVSDDGSGIAPMIQDRVFEPFFSTKTGEGFGLGLAMVYRVAQNHKGLIEFDSQPGSGTRFRLYLPEIEVPAEKKPPPKAKRSRQLKGSGTVLIAEDDLILLEAFNRTLKGGGYKTIVTKNGREALAQFEKKSAAIGLVLLDLMMPKLLGFQAYKLMLKLKPDLKVLFVTGQANEGLESNIRVRGLPIMAKPFTPDDLIAAVGKAFNTKTTV